MEVDGRFQFGLPGTALFPRLPAGVSLKPELSWKIASDKAVRLEAELAYLTDGLNWSADYNAIVREDGNFAELAGLITIQNDTSQSFREAEIRVIAGDVNRAGEDLSGTMERVVVTGSYIPIGEAQDVELPERTRLDEYYEHTLPRPTNLERGATAQVEFMRAADIKATRSFVYHGADLRFDYDRLGANLSPEFGTQSSRRVLILFEFENKRANHLGVPLPRGRFHFYRQAGPLLQFTGDAPIPDAPVDETIKLVSGSAFDLVGERRQTNFRLGDDRKTVEETFAIKLRNQRPDAAEIRVVEHPARWREWAVIAKSEEFKKIDSRTIEFRVPVKPGAEKIVTYTIRYTQLPAPRMPEEP